MTTCNRNALVLTLSFVLLCADAQTGPALTEHQTLARDIFRELIEINTTHDLGSTKAAEAMAARLQAAGFPAEDVSVTGPLPHKKNLVARLRGRGRQKPILLLAHLDVVEARREDWSYDPFRLTEKDGYFYGRGTCDIKNEAAELVANFIRLKQEGYQPARDFILALTEDEEAGAIANGVDWLLEEHRDIIEAEYCLNTDMGGGDIRHGRRISMGIQTGEKVYMSLQLEVTNRGGHSSLPVKDNAIYHLAEGLARLAKFDFPLHLNETTRNYFERMARQETGQLANDMKAMALSPPDPDSAARLTAASAYYNALLRTTAVATCLEGGHADNALPQMARAVVNCRILPDESPDEIQKTIEKLLAGLPIRVSPLGTPTPSPLSPWRADLEQAVQSVSRELWPEVMVVPIMSTGASDGAALRRAGIPVYGVNGMFEDIDDNRAHGRDERIGVKEFYDGLEFTYRLLKALK